MGCHKWPQSRWLPDSSKSEKWQSKAAKSRRPSDSSVEHLRVTGTPRRDAVNEPSILAGLEWPFGDQLPRLARTHRYLHCCSNLRES